MKKVMTSMLLVIFCFMISAVTVCALMDWTSGYTFFEKGTSYSRDVTTSKKYTTFLRVTEKYTEPAMDFKASTSKGNLGIIPASGTCTVASGTDVSGRECTVLFTRSTPDKVNTTITWKQNSDGRLTGELSIPSE